MSRAADTQSPSPQTLVEAAQWFALLESDAVCEADRQRWRDWLSASDAHRTAWRRVEQIDRQFDGLPAGPARQALDSVGQSRRRFLTGTAGLVLAAPLGLAAWRGLPWELWRADEGTAVGEVRELQLPGGGRLWLNTDTAINLSFDAKRRRIQLLTGEVHIHTGADARPLEVTTPNGSVRPLGTQFGVRLSGDTFAVSVKKGRVSVEPGRSNRPEQLVEAGQSARFDQTGLIGRSKLDSAELAWTRGLLMANDMPLDEFLTQLERYRTGVIRWDERAARLKLVGSYPLADTDRILTALEDSLPVRVTRLTPWWVKVESLE